MLLYLSLYLWCTFPYVLEKKTGVTPSYTVQEIYEMLERISNAALDLS